MATDTTNIQSETVVHESDVERAALTQGATQVQVPQGENVVRVQVTPGEAIQLPFAQTGMIARLDDGNGNLAIKVGDITVILQGYIAAAGEADVTLLDANGQPVDVAAVVAATDPNLDIQTAAGPGAGDQGTGADNNGGVFSPFDPRAGIGGLNAVGGLQATALQYNLIEREAIVYEVEEEDGTPDTTPTVVNITQAPPVNEDDLHDGSNWNDVLDRLNPKDEEPSQQSRASIEGEGQGGAPKWVLAHEYDDGNDPFDTNDHEEGSQTDTWFGSEKDGQSGIGLSDNGFGGVDRDREPTSVTAIVEANFFGDLPGKLVLDADGDGIDDGGADVPLMRALEDKGLTSHGHALTYILLPEVPESAPGMNDGHGQMVVAYYTVIKYGCPTNVVVFTISVDDDVVNAGDSEGLNDAGNAEFGLTFTVFGVIDHPTNPDGSTAEGSGIEDILNIEVPFFLKDSDSAPVASSFPQPLVFKDIDDIPFLGEVCYASFCGFDIPIAIVKADLTIGHDETPGVQDTNYDTNGDSKGGWNETDDVGGSTAWHLINKADDMLDGIANGHASGEGTDIDYQQDILSQLSNEYLNNGNFCADALGVAKTYLTVSFGADGKAKGNDQAGETLFQHDSDGGTDKSTYNYNSDGTKSGDASGVDKRAFELFMKDTSANGSNPVLDKAETNWTISWINAEGEVETLTVYAFQLDANTIIGMASPTDFNGGGGGGDNTQALSILSEEGGNHCIDGEGDGIPVFMLRLDPQTGQLVFVQYHQVNNALGGNADHPDFNNSANDPAHLTDAAGNPLVFFQATDFDGDTVTAALQVSVIDDAPKAKDDYAEVNEGCDTVCGNLITGISYDGNNSNNVGKDKLSVDEGHKISALKHDGVTYTLELDADGNPTGVVHVSNGPDMNLVDGKLIIETELGGKLTVQMTETGSEALGWYEYKSPESVEHGDPVFRGFTPKADNSNNSESEWANAFSGFNIERAGSSGDGFNFGDIEIKTVTVDGNSYRGIGLAGGLDSAEVDKNDGAMRIGFPGAADQWSATVTVGALFGNNPNFDGGRTEKLTWKIYDNGVLVGQGVVQGDYDGIVQFHIAEGIKFDRIELSALDNGAGNNGNNSDFLLLNVTTTKCDDDKTEKFEYTLQDADGDTSKATLSIDVEDLGPDAGCGVKYGSETIVKEKAINDGQDPGPDGGTQPGSPDEVATGQINGFDLGPDSEGAAINIQLVDANDSDSNSNNGTVINDAGDLRSKGQPLTLVSDGGIPATITAYRQGDNVKVFSLVIDGNGNYEFKLFDQLDHPDQGVNGNETGSNDVINLKFEYTIVDGDACAPGQRDSQNDVAKGILTISVQDDGPTVSIRCVDDGSVEIDESADNQRDDRNNNQVPAAFTAIAGYPGSIIEWAQDSDAAVSVTSNLGADRPGTIVLSVEVSNPGADSGIDFVDSAGTHRNVVLTKEGDLVVGRVADGPDAGKAVFAVGIDQGGHLQVVQYAPIQHDNTNNHDDSTDLINSALKVKVTATDFDGDKAYDWTDVGDLVKFYDDGPKVGKPDVIQVDDDDLPGVGNDNSNSPNDDFPTSKTNVVTGNLNVDFGTDGPGDISFAALDGVVSSYKSGGLTITYHWDAATHTLTADTSAGPVFTLVLTEDGNGDPTGAFTFTQHRPYDHPNESQDRENNINLELSFRVTDGDGDKADGTLKIDIDDDMPRNVQVVAGDGQATDGAYLLVDEDHLDPNGNEDTDTTPQDDNGGVVATGFITASVGADQPATFGLDGVNSNNSLRDASNNLVKTVEGYEIYLTKVGDTITAKANVPGGGSGNDFPVFTLTINPATGQFDFTLLHALKHSNSGQGASSTEANNIKLSFDAYVEDYDGDKAPATIKIAVDDDAPKAGSKFEWTVDEDSSNYNNTDNSKGLPGAIPGDGQGGANGDSNGGNPDYIGFAGKELNISYGADGPKASNPIQFLTSFSAKDGNGAPITQLKSGGDNVTLAWSGNVLTGWAGGEKVFELTVHQGNPATVDFILLKPIDHPLNNGSEFEDQLSIEFSFTAEDGDGDKITHSMVITVNDDSPDACCMETPVVIEQTGGVVDIADVTINPGNYTDPSVSSLVTITVSSPTGGAVLNTNNNTTDKGFGITSNGGNSEARYNEINYLGDGSQAQQGEAYSEVMTFKLADGKFASSAIVDFNVFFGNEGPVGDEVGQYMLYKDGNPVSGWISFSATSSSGDLNGYIINGPAGGFDEIRFIAAPGTVDPDGNTKGDSSDYNIEQIKFDLFEGEPTTACGYVCGDNGIQYGADGPGSAVLVANPENNAYVNEQKVVESVSQDGHTLEGKVGDDVVYTVTLDPVTGKYVFTLIGELDGDETNLEFKFKVTDADGDSDTGCIKITVEGTDDTPDLTVGYGQLTTGYGIVDEDHLAGIGNQDLPNPSAGDDFNSDSHSFTGTYNADFFGDIPGSVTFNTADETDTGIDTLDGTSILWNRVSDTEMVGYKQGTDASNPANQYFKITLNGTNPSNDGDGTWTFELLKPVKHSEIGVEDNKALQVEIIAHDKDGDPVTAKINVQIDDDLQNVTGETASVDENTGGAKANVMFILDVSGSMGWEKDENNDPEPGEKTRLQIAKEAIQATVQKYIDAAGDANVRFQLVTFSGGASTPNATWMTAAEFLVLLGNTGLGQNSTNYDSPLVEAQTAFASSGKIDGGANVSYFLSDGEPNAGSNADGQNNENGPTAGTTGDSGIGTNEQAAWTGFLDANDIVSYAIGMGPGSSVVAGANNDELDPIAHNGVTGADMDAIGVADMANLEAVLGGTVSVPVTGNLLANDQSGADGWATQAISKVTFLGIDHFPDANGVITIETAAGTLTVWGKAGSGHAAGDYSFDAGDVNADTPLSFTYTTVDGDGDTVTGTLDLTVEKVNEAPVANNVSASGNEDAASIAVALSGTDDDGSVTHFKLTSLPGNGSLYVNGVLAVTGIDYVAGSSVTFTPNANYAGPASFQYTVKDNDGAYDATPATASITVNQVNDAPTVPVDSNAAANTVAENASNGTTVGITGFSTDLEGPVSYSLADNAGGRFQINSSTGVVTVSNGTLLNFEAATSHDITIRATDSNGISQTQTFTIGVTNVNEAPFNLVDTNAAANSIAENSANGTLVGITAQAQDPDAGSVLTYSLSNSAGGRFQINATTGVVSVANGALLDYETNTSHQITVVATDAGGLSTSQNFTINLTDVVENVAPVGGKDHIYTNSTDDVTVLSAWLLSNDTDANGDTLSVTNVAENTSWIASINDGGLPTSFTFNLSDSNADNGESDNFNYDLSDGKATTNVTSTIHLDTSGSIDGGATDDIVIGGSGGETLVGNGGADFLIGNGGNDTLVFDAADKLVDGGSGFDRIQTTASSFAFDTNPAGGAKFASIEMVDLGDSNHNGNRTVTINAADLLDNPAATVDVDQSGGGTNNITIDLFVIGDNTDGARDNVNLTGFTKVADLDNASGFQDSFQYNDGTFGNHTYNLYTNNAGKYVAVEVGLDVTTN